MGIRDKIHSITETAKYAASQAKVGYAGAKELGRKSKDKVAAFRKDYEVIRNDARFETFLDKTGQKLDWDTQESEIKDACIVYERTSKIVDTYSGLFEDRLKNIVGDNPEIKTTISDQVHELAKNDPEQLRKLAKQVDAVAKNEKQLAAKQSEIDAYKKKGGESGLRDKVDTLKKANSFKRVLAQTFGLHKLGKWSIGSENVLAYETAAKKYGIKGSEAIKAELKLAKKDLKAVTGLENKKVKIKSAFSESRGDIFLDNETAQLVQEKIKSVIVKRTADLASGGTIQGYKDLRKLSGEIQTQFIQEGVNQSSGERRDVDFLGMQAEDFDKLDDFINQRIAELLEEKYERVIRNNDPSNLELAITKYFKKREFAGMTKKESAEKVYQTFMKIKEGLPSEDAKAIALGKILRNVQYLTV